MAQRKKTAQKKSSEKKSSKSSRKQKSSTPARTKVQPMVRQALERAKPLLKILDNPTLTGCKTAREIITNLVLAEKLPAEVNPVDKLVFLLALRVSVSNLEGYATLDSDHIKQINSLVSAIETYINDSSQQRPLNFMMLATPGAGKSHFIKCIASRLARKNIGAITFNMAGMQTNEDFVSPLDAARNLKVEDRVPLLFLDEFDSSSSNYALLLPLLWDGGLSLGQRDLKLGKVIIVMAGSDPTLPDTMDHARSMRADTVSAQVPHDAKLVDLFSRVNGGVLRIPPFYDVAHKIDRRVDKVCIAVELLKKRFGGKLAEVPLSLLRFIALVDFRYDVRSIAHLIDLIPFEKNLERLDLSKLGLPLDSVAKLKISSLAYHLVHEDQAFGVVKDWQEACKSEVSIPIQSGAVKLITGWSGDLLERILMPEVLRGMGAKIDHDPLMLKLRDIPEN